MSGVADYVDRHADVLLYAYDAVARGEQLSPPDLAAGSGHLVTGVHKMAQWFLLELLTPVGSVAHRGIGTGFLSQAKRGVWRTSADVTRDYALAAAQARRAMRLRQRVSDPADERLAKDELISVAIASGSVSLRIALTSAAGDRREYVVPIDIAIR